MIPVDRLSAALTSEERRIIAAYRVMDRQAKNDVVRLAERRAHAHPAHRPAALRLVVGGAA